MSVGGNSSGLCCSRGVLIPTGEQGWAGAGDVSGQRVSRAGYGRSSWGEQEETALC